MTDSQLLLKKINGELQSFTEEAHNVFRYLADACDLFVKGDTVGVNSAFLKTDHVISSDLLRLRHNLTKDVAKSYDILPLSAEHLRACSFIWQACYRAKEIIHKLSNMTGKAWVEGTSFYDNVSLIGASVLNEFEGLLENLAIMTRNREGVWKSVDYVDQEFIRISEYIKNLNRLLFNEIKDSPWLVVIYELTRDFSEVAKDLLEASEFILAIALSDSAVD